MESSSEISEEEWRAWRTFVEMRRRLDQVLERELHAAGDISRPEYDLLMTVFAVPGRRIRARELAERLGWEKSRVSHQVTRMDRRGLVARSECDTDLRGSWVELTPAGTRAVLGTMREHAANIRRYFLDVLTPEELETVADISARVLAAVGTPACDEESDPADPEHLEAMA
ncbi:MarR family winged helix-turn-helix transcriptional regulator [Galbitalea soli]|uniref:Winged helix-turn-helix transcriptional regulator n=1 Tax=Galbitalea soli TaxID=1268042 RepID=A0A7C9PQ19_9MICO|nr:MarR family winged helix-turn-helix transcriptional regulator [Galbitalea soli]NEM92469.1 winged helix-turn-helix transcriptional regulator [Galbitalea soli]NYJ29504.1 DNA-binding MarR family transcriptional regulator [Galbitalea soli]